MITQYEKEDALEISSFTVSGALEKWIRLLQDWGSGGEGAGGSNCIKPLSPPTARIYILQLRGCQGRRGWDDVKHPQELR